MCCLYIVATSKTRYVSDNEKGLGCGLNKGKMCRLICFREQSKIGSKWDDMFRYCDINQHVSSQVETALADVNPGKIEAARSMGSSTLGIIFRVYLHEALPDLIRVTTITAISLIGLTTSAGAVGAGGIGSFAINYGQNLHYQDVVNLCVILLLIIVSLIQLLGNTLSKATTNKELFHK